MDPDVFGLFAGALTDVIDLNCALPPLHAVYLLTATPQWYFITHRSMSPVIRHLLRLESKCHHRLGIVTSFHVRDAQASFRFVLDLTKTQFQHPLLKTRRNDPLLTGRNREQNQLRIGSRDAELGQRRADTHSTSDVSYSKDAEVKQPVSRLVGNCGGSDASRERQTGTELHEQGCYQTDRRGSHAPTKQQDEKSCPWVMFVGPGDLGL